MWLTSLFCSHATVLFSGIFLYSFLSTVNSKVLPIVAWHGLGDSYDGVAISMLRQAAREVLGETSFVYAVRLANNTEDESRLSFNGNIANELSNVCSAMTPIFNSAVFNDGYDAVGFSQGGLFLRALIEACPVARGMRYLMTIGSPHQGISKLGVRLCSGFAMSLLCKSPYLQKFVYLDSIQKSIIPATYIKFPQYIDLYLSNSILLGYINNERIIDSVYKSRFIELKKLILVKFDNDDMIYPPDSAWFYEQVANGTVLTYKNTALYLNDLIGLRQLDDLKKLYFESLPGPHMSFTLKSLSDLFKKHFK